MMMMGELVETFGVSPTVAQVIVGTLLALGAGSLIRLVLLTRAGDDQRKQRSQSLASWWVLTAIFLVVVLLGRGPTILFFALLSFGGLLEFLALRSSWSASRGLRSLALLAVPLNFLWIYLGWYQAQAMLVPVLLILLFSIRAVVSGRPEGFVQAVSGVTWGVLLLVFCVSHVAMLWDLPTTSNPVGGSAGWLLYLVLLTEMNDIAQALWGRRLGKHRVTPRVSPKKSWEGLILGTLSTLVLAVILAPLLTPLADDFSPSTGAGTGLWRWAPPLAAGLIIALGGFFGDVTMSAVKRDAGVKDSGRLVPGQGGLLDRIDSLTFTAPLFYYFAYLLYR